MLPVVSFGEILIDFLGTGTVRQGELDVPVFQQFPGGAPANVAVAVARLGGRALFAGQVSRDRFGEFLVACLQRYGVDTSFVARHPSAPTALAFVALDAHGERSFAFHRVATADLLVDPAFVRDEWFAERGIFHASSNLLTAAEPAAATLEALRRARAAGCLTSFDVNLRPALWPADCDARATIGACLPLADVVKASRDEVEYLAPGRRLDAAAREWVAAGTTLVLVTDGARPVWWFAENAEGTLAPPPVEVRDTTAAGDAFTGAFLHHLAAREIGRARFRAFVGEDAELRVAVRFAVACAAVSVTRAGAFPSLATAAEAAALEETLR